MSEHTPGPWHERYAEIVDSDNKGIALVNLRHENHEANANLICAAPVMKDAGCTLASYVYSIQNPGSIPEHVKSAMAVFEAVSK